MNRWACAVLVLTAFGFGFVKLTQRPSPASFRSVATIDRPAASSKTEVQSQFVSQESGPHRHAASLVELGNGQLRAFWFSGSREGAADVVIRSAVFDPAQSRWQNEITVVDRAATQSALQRYIKKLGNPVAVRTLDGKLYLFYVTVSLGGWAGSSITIMTSLDDGQTWSQPRRLITSPFINVSTLVKGTPFLYTDGSIGLPVYHEFIGKFAELLRLDANGKLIDKQRLSHGRRSLQPQLLVQDANRATVLMRHAGPSKPNRVLGVSTRDSGRQWTPAERTTLPNPSAAVTGVSLPDGALLAVINNIESDRDALSLMISTNDGQAWREVSRLEDQLAWRSRGVSEADFVATAKTLAHATDKGSVKLDELAESARKKQCTGNGCAFEFSYPYMIRSANGDVHLVYTWNRSAIKHLWFPRAWVEATKVIPR